MTSNEDIKAAAATNATELDAGEFADSDLGDEDLEAIAQITSLTSVRFIAGDIDSYAPLAKLPALRTLGVNHWSTNDLSSIGEITQLTKLDLSENERYDDIGFIAKLVNLEQLDLEDGQFEDLTPLSGLKKLRVLNLTNCDEVTDCSPLSSITTLEELHLNSTSIDDVTPLANLNRLELLDIRGTEVTDLGPLNGLSLSRGLLVDDDREYDNRP